MLFIKLHKAPLCKVFLRLSIIKKLSDNEKILKIGFWCKKKNMLTSKQTKITLCFNLRVMTIIPLNLTQI